MRGKGGEKAAGVYCVIARWERTGEDEEWMNEWPNWEDPAGVCFRLVSGGKEGWMIRRVGGVGVGG